MAIAFEQLLAEPTFVDARPEVLVATERPVTWVHSSEIYEIASLLDGGEVLLTTGLGLIGADDAALARYAEGIGERGAAALVLELGRTFITPPPALVEACERARLGLVVLHAVVPFVRIARIANERILDHEAQGLRRANEVSQAMADALLHRTGVRAMVATLADLTGVEVQLVDVDGKVHAGPAALDRDPSAYAIELPDGTWGHLVVAVSDDPHLDVVVARGVEALQVAIAELPGSRRRDAARTLLLDLVRGGGGRAEAVVRRAAALGVPADRPVTALVAVPGPDSNVEVVVAAVGRALRRVVRTDLVAGSSDGVLAVVDGSAQRREVAAELLAAIDREVTDEQDRIRHLTVGPATPRLEQVPTSFGVALVAATTARTVGTDRRLLLPADVALDRALLETDDTTLERLVARVLGPLLEHDASRAGELLPTLLVYLAAGRSKAGAAERLGVRRQTVHERLGRIATMLDLPADDAAAWTTLEVAARAWQVRTAGPRER